MVTAVTMAAYSYFTVKTTAWRIKFRRDANQADNKGGSLAVDSLMNFEAVKVGGKIDVVDRRIADECHAALQQ